MPINANKKSTGLIQQTFSGFAWSGAGIVIQAVLQLFVLATLARLLTPHDFGVVGIAMLFITFVERVGFLGIGPALVQRKELDSNVISTAFSMCVVLGLVICALFYFVAPQIGTFFREDSLVNVLRVLSITFFLESIGTVSENILQRELKFKKLLVANSGAYFIGNACIGVGLALLGYGVWALVAATVSTRLVKVAILFKFTPQKLSFAYRPAESRELLNMGLGFSLGRLISFVALTGDNFVVGRLLGASALGLYSRAYQLMSLPATYFGQLLEKVMFPAMAKKQHDRKQLGQVFLWSIEASSLVGVPASIFMWVLAEEIIIVLFGRQWISITATLKVLSLAMFFRLCYKNSDTLIRSLGAVYQHSARQVVYASVVIVSSAVGCLYGLEYVAVGVSVAVVMNYLLLSQLGLKLLSLSWTDFLKAHLSALWCGALCFISIMPVVQFARAHEWLPIMTLFVSGITAGMSMIVALKLTPKKIRPLLFDWLLKAFHFEKLGKLGNLFVWVLRT